MKTTTGNVVPSSKKNNSKLMNFLSTISTTTTYPVDDDDVFDRTTTTLNDEEYDDDDSTVSELDGDHHNMIVIETNAIRMQQQPPHTTIRRRSFAFSDAEEDDNQTMSTVESTEADDDDFSCIGNDDDDLSLFYKSLNDINDDDDDDDDDEQNQIKTKHVTFGDTTVREYGITVGACTPENMGKCPMELTWEYAEPYTTDVVDEKSITTKSPIRRRLRNIPPYMRRERIAQVQGISVEDVCEMEYASSLSVIRDTIDSLTTSSDRLLSSPSWSRSDSNSTLIGSCQIASLLQHQQRRIVGSNSSSLVNDCSSGIRSNNGIDHSNHFRKQIVKEIPFSPL